MASDERVSEERLRDLERWCPEEAPSREERTAMARELLALRAERDRMRAVVVEALDGWEDAYSYKGEYLADKHGDAEDIARLRAALDREEASR